MKLRHHLEYGAVMTVRAVTRLLPMTAVLSLGTVMGRVFHALGGSRRRLALQNLQAAFPARSEKERAAIARDMSGHFGRLLMALLKFSTMTPEQMLAHVEFEPIHSGWMHAFTRLGAGAFRLGARGDAVAPYRAR